MLSRVADSLYWMSRYIERAENNARIAGVNLQLLLDLTNPSGADPQQQWDPIISSLEENELFASLYASPDGGAVIDFVSLQKKNPNSIHSCLTLARENARTTSEQISSEMWEQINRLYLFVKSDTAKKLMRTSPYEFFRRIIAGSHLFQGITDATMTHGEGWDFIRIGKLLERADCTSRILDVKYHILLPSGEKVGGNVDTIQWMSVLKSCSALEAYRKIYVSQVAPWKVAEFVITHADFPRSIRFSVDSLDAALHRISGSSEAHYANEAERLSGRLRSDLDYVTIGDIFKFGLHEYLEQIQERLVEISNAMYATYCANSALDEFPYGLSRPTYQLRSDSPKNIQSSAPKARYGPKGSFADQTRLPMSSVARPTSEPRSEPAKTLNKTARHPRNAPMAARNFKSPRPIASRGI